MMLTRCPVCQTVFRLQSGQLQSHDGEVRCGHCYTPFNALQHQIGARSLGNATAANTGMDDAPAAAIQPGIPARPDAFPLVNEPGLRPQTNSVAPPPATQKPLAQAWAGATDPQPSMAAGRSAPAEDTPDTLHLDARYGRVAQPASPLLRMLKNLVLWLLFGMLVAQCLYLMRARISLMMPGLRPLLVASCLRMGCEVALPKKIGEISIASSDLQSDPAQNGRYILNAVVRNHADHLQAWPHLELTLTDGQDNPLARRAFTPLEWAPEAFRSDAMAAHASITSRLTLDISALSPTGYRLYVFYP